jgi:hypothetical protein
MKLTGYFYFFVGYFQFYHSVVYIFAPIIRKYEYPQSSKSVNSMLETWLIIEFQSIKRVRLEVSPIELVAELIKVELQDFLLYVMVGVKNVAFGVADRCLHPWEHLSNYCLSFYHIGFMSDKDTMGIEGRIRDCGHSFKEKTVSVAKYTNSPTRIYQLYINF